MDKKELIEKLEEMQREVKAIKSEFFLSQEKSEKDFSLAVKNCDDLLNAFDLILDYMRVGLYI